MLASGVVLLVVVLQHTLDVNKENIMAIAPSFTTGLLGYNPREEQLQQQKMLAGLFGQAASPYEKIGIGIGQLCGALIGGLMGDSPAQKKEKAVMDVKQQADAQFAPGTAEYFSFVAENLPAEYADSRAYAAQEAAKAQAASDKTYLDRVKTVTENPQQLNIVSAPISAQVQAQIAKMSAGGQPLNESQIAALQASPQYQQLIGLTSAQEAGITKQAPVTNERVNQGLYALALKEANGDPEKAAIIYNNREQAERRRVAESGVAPPPGNVPLNVLSQAIDITTQYTKAPKLALDNIGRIAVIGEEVKRNPSALPQFKRELVKLAGDSQIGQNEVKAILGSAGFASDVINGVNNFLTGAPTNVKIDDVLRGVKALETYTANQYETGRQKAKTVLDQGRIAPETRDAILPPAYKMPKAPPKVGEVRGGYRFKGGDPADEKNYVKVAQ
jgi:hypothetical protein